MVIGQEIRNSEYLFAASQAAYRKAYKGEGVPSWSRHPLPALTEEFIRELKLISPCARVLDIGCGDGNKSVKLAEQGLEVVGVDYEEAAIQIAKERLTVLDPNIRSRLTFLQGDARNLSALFSEGFFHGIFDYQCLASIPPEYWREVSAGYHAIINHTRSRKGLLLLDLLNLEAPNFHGDVSKALVNGHEYVFQPDPQNSQHDTLKWERGLYVYFFDHGEINSMLGTNFDLIKLRRRTHPFSNSRLLWSALMRVK